MTATLTRHDYRALHPAMTDRLIGLGHSLTPEQWVAPSLCDGWRACDVFGHMTYGGITPFRTIVPTLLVKHRGNLHRGSAVESRRYADGHTQDEVMAGFERASHHPVGIGRTIKSDELYVDHVIHELDIRRPLGLPGELSDHELRAALEGAVTISSPLFKPARAAAGRRLVATDLDWSWGDRGHPLTEDSAENLLLDLAGRRL